jgi:hypothetical protein
MREMVTAGIGVLHDTLSEAEAHVISHLFAQGAIHVLVATASMCRSVSSGASLAVVLGTQYYDSSGLGGEDFPVADLIQMLGLASRPMHDESSVCVLMCHAAKKEFYKKFLFEPLPVESHLDQCLHDHLVRFPHVSCCACPACVSRRCLFSTWQLHKCSARQSILLLCAWKHLTSYLLRVASTTRSESITSRQCMHGLNDCML